MDTYERTPESTRAEINRANALKSTGPVTDAGKSRSRFNAFRHGLTGKTIVMPWQDHAVYEAFCKEFFDDLKPEGVLEKQFVQTLADCSWRLNSAAAREANLLSLAVHERAFLMNAGDEQVDDALAEAQSVREGSQVFTNISLYCQRLARQRDKALEQFQKLQKERAERRARDLAEAAALRKLHTQKKISYDPAEDGFVFSAAEIDNYIRREARKKEAWSAQKHAAA